MVKWNYNKEFLFISVQINRNGTYGGSLVHHGDAKQPTHRMSFVIYTRCKILYRFEFTQLLNRFFEV